MPWREDIDTSDPSPASPRAPQPAPAPGARPALPVAELVHFHAAEADVESRWRKLQEQGYGYRAVRARLQEAGGDPEARDRLLRAADEAQADFLDRLDTFSRALHLHFMAQIVSELDRAVRTMERFYGRRNIRSILRGARALERLAARCRELQPLYGTAGDHRRIAAMQRFYAGSVAFSDRIRQLDPTASRSRPRSLVDWFYVLGRGLVWLVLQAGNLARLAGALLRALRLALSSGRAARGTPFTNCIDDLFRVYGELRGFTVTVIGDEHIPRATPPDVVNVFAPTHRHGVTDNVTLSHLRLPDYLLFSAVDQLSRVPTFLRDRIASTPGLIPVGGGRGPSIARALEALRSGVSSNLVIYPEGSVSEGFKGTRPPRRNFGEELVRRIRAAGLRINLVPVAYLDNARFLDLPARSGAMEERTRRVVVCDTLGTEMIDALLEVGGGEMVNRMVRLAWLERLLTDEAHFLGQERVGRIEARLDLELDGIRYWGSTEPAPIRHAFALRCAEPLVAHEEVFGKKRIRVLRFPSRARDACERIWLPDLEVRDSAELLIGIRAPAHIYLNVGRRRFDGDIFRHLSVKDRSYVYPGIVIRFVNVPVKSLHAIRRQLEAFAGREQRTLSCANSACKLIARAANLKIRDHAEMRPFLPSHVLPTRTIRKLIERGVRDHMGRPVEHQIYTSELRPLEQILREMRSAEIQIALDHLEMATVGALRTGLGALRRGVAFMRSRVAHRDR